MTSGDHKTYQKHLQILFTRLAEYGIIIGPEKCQFSTTESSFLGHQVCPECIFPLTSAVDAIENFVKPEKQMWIMFGNHCHFSVKSYLLQRYVTVLLTASSLRHNYFVNTDLKPLTYVMTSAIERPSLHQTRHLAYIAEFTPDIGYVKGETNFVADALS